VETFFHEIACHAGRINRGVVAEHGDLTVDTCAADIKTMFPKPVTFKKMIDAIKKHYRGEGRVIKTKRGSLGLNYNPEIDSGTLARAELRRSGIYVS
jgi:hypothetical protein